ncbi:Ger(x)C family spore germination protein [Clostridium arbusti]|uniref:Ger(x)C family spore germination protein n=1 Tax=Clostridium arbusti TaxID=1137848 RepID=UPI000289D12F|nr:Ger(x)C family spore germination protein [Clostridium arbusti]
MRKKFFIAINIILCIFILTGCWDTRELNTIGVIYAIGLEQDENKKQIICTVQIAIPSALKQDASRNESAVEILEVRGATISDAIRNLTEKVDRFPDFSQNKIIVIDETLARKGILPILDFFKRSYQVHNTQWIAIAKPGRVKEVLGEQHGIGNIQGSYLNDIINIGKTNAKITNINMMNFYKRTLGDGIDPVAGVIGTAEMPNLPIETKNSNTSNGVKFSGTAVFKGDKLVGYLNTEETKGYNWITGEVKNGNINISSILNSNRFIGIGLENLKPKIKPEIIDNKIVFHIEVKGEGNIDEVLDATDFSDTKVIKQLEDQLEIILKSEIKMCLNKIQKTFNSDIVGFGKTLNRKYPKVWEEKKDNWNDVFPTVQYTIDVDIQLRSPGLMDKPIQSEKLK